MARIAFLGLGKMGSGMAATLARAGHSVAVWNRTPGKSPEGCETADSPAAAAKGADAIFSMVADDEASERVWLAKDGALATAKYGAIGIECSTLSHRHVMDLSRKVSGAGLAYIDCPVNGPPAAAASGKLILLVGASPEDLDRARPLLENIGSSILHFGAVGTGTAFKLINNLLGAVHVASIAEAAALAKRLGLDSKVLVQAVETGPCASPHVKRMIAPMAEGRLSDVAGLAIGLREKDARYCLEMAKAQDLEMSVGRLAHAWYAAAKPQSGAEDDSALLSTVIARNGRITG